jgi:2-hydroxychromene-2-carboxylate isomerase
MSRRLEFFFDFRSPYSYLAYSQLPGLGAEVILRPMMVLKVMEQVGNVPTTLTCAAKGRYARADLGRWAKRYGAPLNPSNMRENDGEACSRAVLAAGSPKDAAAITAALFRACWGEAQPLTDVSEILSVISAAGVDAEPIAARIDDPAIVAALEANTKEAAERGVFGSPTIIVGDDMFFGNDRLDFVRERLALQEAA